MRRSIEGMRQDRKTMRDVKDYRQRLPRALPSRGAEIRRSRGCHLCHVRALVACSALREEELAALEAMQRRQELSSGQTIFYDGDAADSVYVLTHGAVRLVKLTDDGRRQVTGFRFAGDLLGLACRRSYSHTAEAIGAVTVCRIARRQFEKLGERFPGLQGHLLRSVSNELVQAHEQMLTLGCRSPREKLVIFLQSLRRRLGEHGRRREAIHLPMRRSDIADYLGMTVETLSRTFTCLRKGGLIEMPAADTIVLKDEEPIEDFAA